MEPALARPRLEAIDHDELLVHEWRVRQLTGLGIPWSLAQAAAGRADWHQVARLVRRRRPAGDRGRRRTAGSAMIARPPFPRCRRAWCRAGTHGECGG